jgi:SAM-dependent methyltransferase
VDTATAAYYEQHAVDIVERYESVDSPVERYFAPAFPDGGRVLDVGAGSGRDLARLLHHGYDAYGVEPAQAVRRAAIQRHPELVDRLEAGSLPSIGQPFGGRFDGVVCSAVLMHVPDAELFDTAFALRALLRPHGRLLVSLPLSRADVGDSERDVHGRLFRAYVPEYLQLLFERLGFHQIGRWESDDALARGGHRWYTLLFELRSSGSVRAVDQIEGILNRDRKVATYKLALFRALAEIAVQEPRVVSWRADGRVGVPLGRIAERWLLYYWPIFATVSSSPCRLRF